MSLDFPIREADWLDLVRRLAGKMNAIGQGRPELMYR